MHLNYENDNLWITFPVLRGIPKQLSLFVIWRSVILHTLNLILPNLALLWAAKRGTLFAMQDTQQQQKCSWHLKLHFGREKMECWREEQPLPIWMSNRFTIHRGDKMIILVSIRFCKVSNCYKLHLLITDHLNANDCIQNLYCQKDHLMKHCYESVSGLMNSPHP